MYTLLRWSRVSFCVIRRWACMWKWTCLACLLTLRGNSAPRPLPTTPWIQCGTTRPASSIRCCYSYNGTPRAGPVCFHHCPSAWALYLLTSSLVLNLISPLLPHPLSSRPSLPPPPGGAADSGLPKGCCVWRKRQVHRSPHPARLRHPTRSVQLLQSLNEIFKMFRVLYTLCATVVDLDGDLWPYHT